MGTMAIGVNSRAVATSSPGARGERPARRFHSTSIPPASAPAARRRMMSTPSPGPAAPTTTAKGSTAGMLKYPVSTAEQLVPAGASWQ